MRKYEPGDLWVVMPVDEHTLWYYYIQSFCLEKETIFFLDIQFLLFSFVKTEYVTWESERERERRSLKEVTVCSQYNPVYMYTVAALPK